MKNQNSLNPRTLIKYLRLFLATFFVSGLISLNANAQLFTRTTFNATYTAITTSGGATVSTAAGDDVNQLAIPLGFTFNYAGTNHTTLGLNTNGLIWFDAIAPSASEGAAITNMYVAASGGTDQSISAWWSDTQDDASSEILYRTQGSAGSRKFTVQFTNYPHYDGAVGTNIRINCQVIFYETTNVIEFRYGSLSGAGPAATSGGACIGIEYGAGGPGNFIDLVTGSSQTSHGMLSPLVAWPSYNYRLTPGAPTAVAAGTYNVGIGQTYPSLTLASADLNHRGISGPVTLNLTDANYDITPANGSQIFPVFVGPVAGTNAVNTLTISKAGDPATLSYSGSPVTQGGFGYGSTGGLSAISDSEEPIMGVCSRYTTISNINLVSLGTTASDVEIGLMVFEAYGGDSGAQHNMFDKITVNMDRTNTSTIGIWSNNITAPGGAAGTNSYNTYRDLSIRDCYSGINMEGVSSATGPEDVGNQIITSSCTIYNSIGDPAVPNDIGGNTSFTYGISLAGQENFIVRNNIIRNVSTTSSTAAVDGILVLSGKGVCEISNNIIRTIRRNNAGLSSSFILTGIRISHDNGDNEFRVFNNSISELLTSYTGAATTNRAVRGIYFDDTGSGTITHNIWNNSISIDGSTFPNASTTCMELLDGADLTFIVKNNAFANFTSAQTGVASHYLVVTSGADRYGLIASLFDYNDLYVANDQGVSGHVGLGASTKYSTLANWQAGMSFNTGTDANSQSANPFFKNNVSDLHGSFLSTSLEGTGTTPPAYIITDIDCEVRTALHDIGSDDFELCMPNGGTVSPASATLCANDTYNMSSTGFGTDPGTTYQWMVASTSGGTYSNVTGGSGATTTSYTTGKLNSGTYYYVLKATCTGGITDLSNELVITVNSNPSATVTPDGPITFCSGGSVTLNAPVAGNRAYQWKKGSNDIAGATLSSYTATGKGKYKVVVTNTSTGCSKTSSTTEVTVNALPTATITPQGPTTFCEGGSVVLQANTGAGLTYKWKKGSNYISGETLSSYTATEQGNFKVEVTDGNGCSKTSSSTSVTVNCRGENSPLTSIDNHLSLYPNPTTGKFVVNLELNNTSGDQVKLVIVNTLGQSVHTEELTLTNGMIMKEISLSSEIVAGVYWVRVLDNNYRAYEQKLVVQY